MKELLSKYREVIAYLFWGVCTTAVNWVSYSVLVWGLSADTTWTIGGISINTDIAVANVLSWVIAVIFAFFTNKLFVFQSKSFQAKVFWPEFGKFISARIVTGIIEIVCVPLLVGIGLDFALFGIEGSAAKVCVSIIVVILNYIFSKFFVFKRK